MFKTTTNIEWLKIVCLKWIHYSEHYSHFKQIFLKTLPAEMCLDKTQDAHTHISLHINE